MTDPLPDQDLAPVQTWPSDPEVDPWASRMLPRFGWPLRVIARVFFSRIDDDSCDLAPLRAAATKGSLVYVMRTRSLLDYLYFNHFNLKKGLPLARFANGVRTTLWAPLGRMVKSIAARMHWRRTSARKLPDPVDSGYLADLVEGGDPTLVFLRRGRAGWFAPPESSADLVEVLVEAQMKRAEPIFVVPQLLVWERQPDRTNRGLVDVLLGGSEDPGFIRKGLIFLMYHRRAVVRVGEPVDLKEFIAQQDGVSTERVAKKLRWLLLGYLYRERKVVKGPDVRPRRWIFDRILAEPAVQEVIRAESAQQGRAYTATEKRARKILDKAGADYRWEWIMLFRSIIDVVNSRIYSGVEFDPEDAERIRKAARRGTVVLVPSHRSHFDYMLLSWLLFYQGMMPPHIAAGANLAFFPVGTLFRRSGAYFIRRSFSGDELYATLIAHYIRALIQEGYTQEFFIEGGRSRSGKMLGPKVGLLGTYVDAMADRIVPDIQIVPIYIAYERIVEDYTTELSGGEKKRESAGEVLKASSVLRKRFGRVYVKTNEPISLKESLETVDGSWRELPQDDRKAWLKRLGQHIVAEIQDVTVVTPSTVAAMSLLVHDRRGITRDRFHRRCRALRRWLDGRDAPFSDAWQFPEDALDETLELFASEKFVQILDDPTGDEAQDIIAISNDPTARMQLDYYKNNILFHFVPAGFLVTALLLGEEPVGELSKLERRFDFLVDLFKEEFFFHPDVPRAYLIEEAAGHLVHHGVLAREGDVLSVAEWPAARTMVATVQNFFEAYFVVLRGTRVLREGPLTEKELVESAMEVGKRMFLTEDVRYPEAISKVNLTNAVRHFRSKGVLVPFEGRDGRDARLVLDEEARERYMGPMRKLFHSDRLQPKPVGTL